MAHYSTGLETRELILNTCRTLFYENGYEKTSTRDIAAATNTNLSALNYHFGSKFGILDEIMRVVVNRLSVISSDYTRDFGENFILSTYLLWYAIYNDEKFRRLYHDYIYAVTSDKSSHDGTDTLIVYYYKVFDVKYSRPTALKRKYELQGLAASSMEQVCVTFAMENRERYTFAEMAEMNIKMGANLFDIPEEAINLKYKRTRELLKKVNLESFSLMV